jgi:zinc transport system ATP-binding protein
MDMSGQPSISTVVTFDNVSFAYQQYPVLEHVTFSIQAGEAIGVIGPNGGGKTTLLRLMMGLLAPTSGRINLFGSPPHLSTQRISYVPQVAHLDKQFPISVFELVLSGKLSKLPWYGKYSKEEYAIADEMIAKVGLSDLRNRAFGSLSGGQAQRALIARALVAEPQLLLLDEPTASVDAQAEEHIYTLLRNLRGTIATVMVTHDLQAAIEQVDRVLCVQHSVVDLQPSDVCQHFAVGLYHLPLARVDDTP